MIAIRPMTPADLLAMAWQPEQEHMAPVVAESGYAEALIAAGPCFAVHAVGAVIACIGVQEHNKVRAEAWALLGVNCGPHLHAISKAVNGWLIQTSYRRVEANVSTDFEQGHRWAKLLGFQQEGPERLLFFHDGRSAIHYVRLKHG